MTIEAHIAGQKKIAEVVSAEQFIQTAEDGLDLLGNLCYQGFDSIIVQEKHLTPDFFDLQNGIAGEILQKFSTYRIPLAIVGDFSGYTGKSIRDFMFESNKTGHINFVRSTAEALEKLGR